MKSDEVIDLLSSDTEDHLALTEFTQDRATSIKQIGSDFLFLIDDDDHTQEWPKAPAKRRKLSPSSVLKNGTPKLPELPLAGKAYPSHRSGAYAKSPKDEAWATLDGSDPIVFTSSLGATVSRCKGKAVTESLPASGLSDESLPDDLLSATSYGKPLGLSAKTAALLDSLSQPPPRAKPTDVRKRSVDPPKKAPKEHSRASIHHGDLDSTEDHVTKPAKLSKAPKKPKLTEEEKAEKAREKEREKATRAKEKENAKAASKKQRAKEKEEDHEKRRLLKEQKAREKRIAADLAEVNKSKLDKKDSTPEMIVDLPASIDGSSVDTQIREFLKNLIVDATLYQSPIPHTIKWRRKLKARWNTDLDYWEPIDHMEIHEEKHVMCIMSAKEFVSLARGQNDDQDIETHVAKLKSAYENCIPIYLVEGLYIWMRKNKTAENRAYQVKVNSLANADKQPGSRKKKLAAEIVDEDLIEDALLRLQVMHGCLIHHTSTSLETAEWVAHFTEHISSIPYRHQRMNLETTFCMESGQVKTGEDKDDTFVKMLQEVVRVTPPIAYGIASEYTSVIHLVEAFRRHGPNTLEDLQKSANRNGALTDRKIGPAISRRLYKVFMEVDPASTDV